MQIGVRPLHRRVKTAKGSYYCMRDCCRRQVFCFGDKKRKGDVDLTLNPTRYECNQWSAFTANARHSRSMEAYSCGQLLQQIIMCD